MSEFRVEVTTPPSGGVRRWIEIDGRPAIPVVAGMDYSRVPREQWEPSLRRVRESGATAVASTVFWSHHEPEPGALDFTGRLNLAGFAASVQAAGLRLVLRLGPSRHAGARYAGLPDWLLGLPLEVCTDDPAYLAEVTRWFAAVAEQVRGVPLLALQFDRSAGDPGHLATLKVVARQAGLDAPLWLLTGGSADGFLPAASALPDAYWLSAEVGRHVGRGFGFRDAADPWSRPFDKLGAGQARPTGSDDAAAPDPTPTRPAGPDADPDSAPTRPAGPDAGTPESRQARPSESDDMVPMLVGELGVGMNPASHRRPNPGARDLDALVLSRLGAGSGWQGYAQFHDGRNPGRGVQESHAAGSPNDLPELDVDAGAPLAVDGHRRATWYRLRLQHLLLAGWGERLAIMPSTPGDGPDPCWAVRSDGRSGFLFVANRRPGRRQPALPDTRFVVATTEGEVAFPPVTVPGGAAFVWPFRLAVGDATLEWATAQPVTQVEWRSRPLLVLAATAGIEPLVRWREGQTRPLPAAGPGSFGEVVVDSRVVVRWLVLAEPEAWRFGLDDGLVLGSDGLRDLGSRSVSLPMVATAASRHAGPPPVPEHGPLGRVSIPSDWKPAARATLQVPGVPGTSLVLDWVGDAARLWDGERLVADSLHTGREWRIGESDLAGATELVAEFLRIHPDAAVHLTQGRPRGARLNHARLELP